MSLFAFNTTKLNVNQVLKSCAMMGTLLVTNATFASSVENFGQNLTPLKQAFSQNRVHFLQIGDSHTAADYFTEQLRKRLQADVGDGGIGFAYPMAVSGQRVARHGYQSEGWTLTNSRNSGEADYPLGGMFATPFGREDSLTLTSETYAGDTQNANIVIKGNTGQTLDVTDRNGTRFLTLNKTGWQTVNTPVSFPVTFQADNNMSIGGYWLDRGMGGRVSAMGINGATQDYWYRWHKPLTQELAQSQADLVILAYGTNEAFQASPDSQTGAIQYAINQIRQGLPNATILLVNASESLKQTSDGCGERATNLDLSQANIKMMAQKNHTLYWSWQDAMGGSCSMNSWIAQGLGRSDGVHFTREGYEKIANILYDDLKNLIQSPKSTPRYDQSSLRITTTTRPVTITRPSQAVTNRITNYSQQGKTVVCNANGQCKTY